MRKFKIKVCGMTREQDIDLVAELGGDMIGFIFYRRSPRSVSQRRACELSKSASPVLRRVGVFVDAPVETILRVADKVGLDMIQLHGRETNAEIRRLQRAGYRVIKAFSVENRADYQTLYTSAADFVMLDRITSDQPGGSGRTFDWSIRPPRRISNLVLAGGLTADNIARGVTLFQPLVIDVNSGVESSPGIKSKTKLQQFMKICNKLRYGKQA